MTHGADFAKLVARSRIAQELRKGEKESVHIAFVRSGREPSHKCERCERVLLNSHFSTLAVHDFGSAARSSTCLVSHPHCLACRKEEYRELKRHPLFSQDLRRFCSGLATRAKSSAETRRILFAIDGIDVLALFIKQEGICAITGLPMEWKRKTTLKVGEKSLKVPSIDRIDSSKSYALGNIHLVMSVVNIMKTDLPLPAFVQMCRRIADHNLSLL